MFIFITVFTGKINCRSDMNRGGTGESTRQIREDLTLRASSACADIATFLQNQNAPIRALYRQRNAFSLIICFSLVFFVNAYLY